MVKLKFGKTLKSPKILSNWFSSKYPLLFMFLLRTNFAKNGDIYATILFTFLKTVLDQSRNALNTKLSRQTSRLRIFETNFSFDVKQHTTEKIKSLFLVALLLVRTKFLFWHGVLALSSHSIKFRDFPNIS